MDKTTKKIKYNQIEKKNCPLFKLLNILQTGEVWEETVFEVIKGNFCHIV